MGNLIIRNVKIEDYIDISRIRKMPGVIENILATEDEPIERMKNIISNMTHTQFAYVAELDNKVVGFIMMNGHENIRKNHVGYIALMIDSDYHGIGIGTALMNEVINLADNKLKLKRLELGVFIDNEKAIKLYTKCGFIKEGVQKYSALRYGRYTDQLMMARYANMEDV